MGTTYTSYIGLGANLGERRVALQAALRAIEERGLGRVVGVSSIYETEPRHVEDQPDFLNACAIVSTEHEPSAFLQGLLAIEARQGRHRNFEQRFGPRPIDIDLLMVYVDHLPVVLSTPELELPHPRMLQRRFVLAPLAEIGPTLRHPGTLQTMCEALAACTDTGAIRALPNVQGNSLAYPHEKAS